MTFPRFSRSFPASALAIGGSLIVSGCAANTIIPPHSAAWDTSMLAILGLSTAGALTAFVKSRRLRRELERRARELAISEERHRLLLEQASDVIFVADADTGVIIEANRHACELLGWGESELVGQRHTILHPPGDREAMRRAFSEHTQRGGIMETDVMVRHRQGELIPMHARATVVTTGGRRYIQGIFRDLRPRKRAEEALRRSELRLRELFERAPVAILEEDFTAIGAWLQSLRNQGVRNLTEHLKAFPEQITEQFARVKVTGANPAALRAAGASDLESYMRRSSMSVTPAVIDAFRQELEAIWEDRSELVCELNFRRPDDSMAHAVMHWTVTRIDGRLDLNRVVVVFSDLSQLRATEERLREVEDRWELAVRGLNFGIFEKNYITGEIFYSDRWKEMLGFAPHELPNRGEEWQPRIHPDDREEVMKHLQAHLRGESDFYRVEYRMLCKDGSYKWILSRGRAIFDLNGQPLRLIGAHTDISERKAADAALRASEERYRELFERTPVAILEEDFTLVEAWLEQRGVRTPEELRALLARDAGALREAYQQIQLRAANRSALQYLSAQSLEELAPRKYLRPPDGILRAFQTQMEAVLENRDDITVEISFVHENGDQRHQTLRWSAARTEDGQLDLARVRVALIDITDIKRAEETIRRAEERWQLAVRGTQDGIWEFNVVTGENYFSDRWKEMLGYAPHEIENRYEAWVSRIHPDDTERVRAAYAAHNRHETEYYQVEFRMRCKDGSYKWILSRGQTQFDAEGRPIRSLGSHTDITERKMADAALRESETRYRKLFEDNPSPMWVYDRETLRFLAVNAAAVRHYGYSREEFLQMTICDIRPPEDVQTLREELANWGTGRPTPAVWRHRRKDGVTMAMQVAAHPHEFAGRPGVLVLLQDVTERQQAEEKLRASETRYRALFESAVEGVYETSAEGEFLSVNPAFARLLGYDDPKHMLAHAKSVEKSFYVQPDRRAVFFERLGDQEAITGFESEVRCADGTSRWVTENVRALRDETGRTVRLQGFVSDITDRKQAEDAIRASEQRYRVLFEHSPVAVVEYDYREVRTWLLALRAAGVTDLPSYFESHPEEVVSAARKVVMVGMNQETVRMARAGSKQELMEKLDQVFTPDAYAARRAAFLAIWDGRHEIEGEINLRALDGSVRRVFYRWWLPYLDGRDSFEWTQVVLVDLTEIRSTEALLAAERERLRVTLRAMAEALITTDIDGVVQFVNEAAERVTGWTAGAAIGRSVEQICVFRHEKTRASVLVPVATAISEHRVVELPLQTTLVNRHGQPCLVDGRCAPMHDLSGRAIGAVMVFRDVTERSRLEAELLRSSKLESVGILAGGIAHDFNNILTVVMGNVTLAMLDSQVMAAAGRWLAEAERGVMRARDLTQQLLTFAKGGDPVRKAVQLPEVVQDAAEFALHGSKVRCEFEVEQQLWAADVDKGQIGQVVQNLVINAVQAMPEGGVIRVVMRNEQMTRESNRPLEPGSYIFLSIADSGSGIRPEHLLRIFDPYFTTKQSGSGLGLATVYSIVRKHQGHIEVASELGRGTTFFIWLPAAPNATPVTVEAPVKVASLSGRVLFMDDEETIRAVAKSLLARLGFEVTTVTDGAEAVRLYQEARNEGMPFHLVIMDLTVPGGMGGKEAMDALLAIDPHVKAVVSSGYSSDPVLSNYRAHGFRGVVPKPYKLTDLARTLRSVMEEV